MDIKDSEIYPKYSFRLSHSDKEWLDRELDSLKTKFNVGITEACPVVTKNVLLMSALKRGLRFLREDVHSRCIQKNLAVEAEPSRVWTALTDPAALGQWWGPATTLESHVGGRFFDDKLTTGVVTAVVPNESLQFTWKESTWSGDDSTSCCIQLRPDVQGGTRIELVHSGWEVFPEPQVAALKTSLELGGTFSWRTYRKS